MTEALKPGLLDALGRICEVIQAEGCSYDEARERLEQQQRDELEEFADTNIVSLDAFRKRKFH